MVSRSRKLATSTTANFFGKKPWPTDVHDPKLWSVILSRLFDSKGLIGFVLQNAQSRPEMSTLTSAGTDSPSLRLCRRSNSAIA